MKILRRGFELLKTRPLKDALNVELIENEYKITIPPMYRFFSQLFYLRLEFKGDLIEGKGYLSKLKYLPEINLTNDELLFDDLFPLDFSASTYEEYDFWSEKGLMQIGDGPSEGGILLKIEGDNIDSIVYNDGNKYYKLSDNIFDFFKDVVIVQVESSEINIANIYKYWNDEKWRNKQ